MKDIVIWFPDSVLTWKSILEKVVYYVSGDVSTQKFFWFIPPMWCQNYASFSGSFLESFLSMDFEKINFSSFSCPRIRLECRMILKQSGIVFSGVLEFYNLEQIHLTMVSTHFFESKRWLIAAIQGQFSSSKKSFFEVAMSHLFDSKKWVKAIVRWICSKL